jgi:hypothetical protein
MHRHCCIFVVGLFGGGGGGVVVLLSDRLKSQWDYLWKTTCFCTIHMLNDDPKKVPLKFKR